MNVRAPYASPPTALAAAHTDSSTPAHSGAPCSEANAGRLISTAPKQNPTGIVANISVRTPRRAQRAQHPVRRADLATGRQLRDGGCMTNSATPRSVHSALSPSAATGETIAMIAAEISGPSVNSSSIATESSANAAGSSSLAAAQQLGPERAQRRADVRDREAAEQRRRRPAPRSARRTR